MKVLLKLAVRNLLAAGLRTWLNVIVLSLTFVVIITAQGLFRGMGDQAERAGIEFEFGGGQYWHPAYDPYDPLTIQDAHSPIPAELQPLIASGQATPILIIQGTLYPQGRFLPVLIKGIDPEQPILKLPSAMLLKAPTPEQDEGVRVENKKTVKQGMNKGGKSIVLNESDELHKNKLNDSGQANFVQSSASAPLTLPGLARSVPSSSTPVILNSSSPQAPAAAAASSEAVIPDEIPAIIGTRLATAARLSVGDTVILRWRDSRGVFDARTLRIVHIFRTIVQSVDAGQVWIPLPILQAMARMPDEATIITLAPGVIQPSARLSSQPDPISSAALASSEATTSSMTPTPSASSDVSSSRALSASSLFSSSPPSSTVPDGWIYRDLPFLLRDINQVVAAKTVGSAIVFIILLFMALLAIFDTQVLNIFHRIKEIGTLVALGLTRRQIVLLFTLEGTLHAVLAAFLAALYGYPLLSAFARTGWKMPEAFDKFGLALGERLLPIFTAGIISGTFILIITLTAIISFMPARRLSRLRPTEALRGKLQ